MTLVRYKWNHETEKKYFFRMQVIEVPQNESHATLL